MTRPILQNPLAVDTQRFCTRPCLFLLSFFNFFFSLVFLTPFFVLKMGVEVLQTRDWTRLQAQGIKLYL